MNLLAVQQTTEALRTQSKIVILMIAFSVMSYFDRTIMSIAGPGIMKEFNLSEPQLGAIFTAFLISYAGMNLPGGYMADRLGPRLVLTLVGLGAGLFTALTALGGEPGLGTFLGIVPAFFLIRLVLGICTGPLYPTCARTMGNWIPPTQHARVQGFIAGGAGLGAATSPLLFSWMIGTCGWRMSFCIAGIATAILALAWLWYFRDQPFQHPALRHEAAFCFEAQAFPEKRQKGPTPWKRLLADRSLMLLAASYFAVSYCEYIYFFWIYYYLGEIRHLGSTQSAIATTIINLAWMVMSPLGGWISDRLVTRYGERSGRRIVPMGSLTLAAIFLCIGINVTSTVATVS
jgi:MFS transporter, ACS family, glucarate transporter